MLPRLSYLEAVVSSGVNPLISLGACCLNVHSVLLRVLTIGNKRTTCLCNLPAPCMARGCVFLRGNRLTTSLRSPNALITVECKVSILLGRMPWSRNCRSQAEVLVNYPPIELPNIGVSCCG